MTIVHFQNWGLIPYQIAWEKQEKLFAENVSIKLDIIKGNKPLKQAFNYFILCQHPHVYTLGKSGNRENLLVSPEELIQLKAEFVHINRGGDITYHGPEQIVGYPILDLEQFFPDIHKYLRLLEEVIILTLKDFNIQAGRFPGYTGVWIEPEEPSRARKICAIGVRCSRWITMHGFAFNINTNLDYFKHIVPCGIEDKAVTSMEKELNHKVDINQVQTNLKFHFAKEFGCILG